MSTPNHVIKLLIPPHNNFSAADLVEHIGSVIYGEEAGSIRDMIYEVPESVRTIILLIDFDTELTMNGILGFLENSTGKYLNETISALKLIKAEKDLSILEEIKELIEDINFNRQIKIEPYQVTTFEERHDLNERILERIKELADGLYVYSIDRDIFDYLTGYLSDNWIVLLKELKDVCK
ncbi:DMP19 family protein [Paenibacillus polymyxa]|uniref:DMP19 family protein n=1 Tax=Paenibacillus polymyxa TaxID=1406 RepID=UPI0032163EF8